MKVNAQLVSNVPKSAKQRQTLQSTEGSKTQLIKPPLLSIGADGTTEISSNTQSRARIQTAHSGTNTGVFPSEYTRQNTGLQKTTAFHH